MPPPFTSAAHPAGRKYIALHTATAPRMTPGNEPSPPITTIVNSAMSMSAVNEPLFTPCCCTTKRAPANPAMAPEITKAVSFWRVVLSAVARAAGSLSRVAMRLRPVLLRRSDRTPRNTRKKAIRQK